ncbi:MAG: hypothetical protein ACMXYE_02450 [Candidatus Woesearchaeota archaeon]
MGIRLTKLKLTILPDIFVAGMIRRQMLRKTHKEETAEHKSAEKLKKAILDGNIDDVKKYFKEVLEHQEKHIALFQSSGNEIIELMRRVAQNLLDIYNKTSHPGEKAEIGSTLSSLLSKMNEWFKETERFERGTNIRLSPSSVQTLEQETAQIIKVSRRRLRQEKRVAKKAASLTSVKHPSEQQISKATQSIAELKKAIDSLEDLIHHAFDNLLIIVHKENKHEVEVDKEVYNKLQKEGFPEMSEIETMIKSHMEHFQIYQKFLASLNTLHKWFVGQFDDKVNKHKVTQFEEQQKEYHEKQAA